MKSDNALAIDSPYVAGRLSVLCSYRGLNDGREDGERDVKKNDYERRMHGGRTMGRKRVLVCY